MEQFNNTITPLELADCLGGMTVQGVYKALKTHNIPTQTTNNRRKIIPAHGIRKLFEDRGFKISQKLAIATTWLIYQSICSLWR